MENPREEVFTFGFTGAQIEVLAQVLANAQSAETMPQSADGRLSMIRKLLREEETSSTQKWEEIVRFIQKEEEYLRHLKNLKEQFKDCESKFIGVQLNNNH